MYGKKFFSLLLVVTLLCAVGLSACKKSTTTSVLTLGDASDAATSAATSESKPLLTEENEYDADGKVIHRVTYAYDENGNTTGSIDYGPDGEVDYRYAYTYDENGNRTEQTRYDAEGSPEVLVVRTYDADGNPTEVIDYGPDGSLLSRTTYAYDENGDPAEVIVCRPDGSVMKREVYENGSQTEKIEYSDDGVVIDRRVYTYDENGNRTGETWYDSDGTNPNSLYGSCTYTYDANGNQAELTTFGFSGSVWFRIAYEYDGANNLMKETYYETDDDGVEAIKHWTEYKYAEATA